MKQPAVSLNRIIITGGPTREWIDPVRFISNASSGKMGIALAQSARAYCDDVIFIHGPLSVTTESVDCRKIAVETTLQMRDAVLSSLADKSILVMAAAPADYMPVSKAVKKIKKDSDSLKIECVKTPDILKAVNEKRRAEKIEMYAAGFAAETDNAENYAKSKLVEKGLDVICMNDLSKNGAGFEGDTNIVTMFFADGSSFDIPLMQKSETAEKIFEEIMQRITF
jgi:phosphopantothenoylcysteine decarboxylase / phosphopantothenate---cysteine ligase